MAPQLTAEELRDILVSYGGIAPERVTTERATRLDLLGLDSVGLLSVMLEIEARYSARLFDEDAPSFTTLGSALDLINARLANPG